jgi:hypothetical protein
VAWAAQRRSAKPCGSKNPRPKRLKSCLGSAKTCPAGMHRNACGAAAGLTPPAAGNNPNPSQAWEGVVRGD